MKPLYIENPDIPTEPLFEELMALPWVTERTARREYFMSDTPRVYTYGNRSGVEPEYHSNLFTPLVLGLKDFLNEELGEAFNVCFLNRYEDQKQHLGWHADDFAGMDPQSSIAVVSFGAVREIWWKEKEAKGEVPKDQRQALGHGSVWVMPPGMQDTHVHKIPKHDRECGVRISLTFRKFN